MIDSVIELKGKRYVVVEDANYCLNLIPEDKFEAFSAKCYKYTDCPLAPCRVKEVVFGAGDFCTVLHRYDHEVELWKMDAGASAMALHLEEPCNCSEYIDLSYEGNPDFIPDILKQCEEEFGPL